MAKRTDRFAENIVDDEVVLMRLDTGETLALGGTAAEIWRLIDGQRSRDAIVTTLAGQFDLSEADIGVAVDEFLHQLRGSGLIAAR